MNDKPSLLAEAAQNPVTRRHFLRRAGIVGALGTAAPAAAAFLLDQPNAKAVPATDLDVAVLNFALNLEYLEAEYYCYAASGKGLVDNGSATFGAGTQGTVTVKANAAVPWSDPLIQQYANEIAVDEITHVNFLRGSLYEGGATYYAEPDINLLDSFNKLAVAAEIGSSFDPFASDVNFLLGSFIFEDVGVTAYHGAAPLLTNPDYLLAAAGILAVEAYHAGILRTTLFALSQQPNSAATYGIDIVDAVNKITALRSMLSGGSSDSSGNAITGTVTDQGIVVNNSANLTPTDANSLAFARNTREVLNIVYGSVGASSGLFFPSGMNGIITM